LDQNESPATAFGIPGLNLGTLQTGGEPSIFFNYGGNNYASSGNSNGVTQIGDGLNVGRCNCPLTESEQQFQIVNNWTKIKGNHTIKFGADIRYAENLRVPSDNNRTGILNFDGLGTSNNSSGGLALATFLLGDVTSFNRFVSTSTSAAERQKRYFFYGQDTWHVTTKLVFNYGLRWEIYTPENVNAKGNGGFANLVDGVINVAGYDGVNLSGNVRNDYKAFAPRLGIAYQYDPKTVVRVGYGRSFDIGVFGSNFGHVVTQNLPVLANQSIEDSNLNAANTNNVSPVFTLAQGPPAFNFTNVINGISSTGTLPLLGLDGTSGSRIRPTIQRLPTVDAWNATLQRQITPTISVEIAYVGNKGTHVFNPSGPSYNPNEPAVGGGVDIVQAVCSVQVTPCPAADVTGAQLGSFAPFLPPNERRKYFLNGIPAFTYPGFTFQSANALGQPISVPTPPCCAVDLTYFGNDASTNYNSLQAKVEKRFSNGLQFLAHFTFSHSNAFDSGYYDVNPKIAYGPDQYNRDKVFVLNSVYELPFGRGKRFLGDASRALDYVVGGWQVTNTLNYSSGLPWTATIGDCGETTGNIGPCRPNLTGQNFKVGARKVNGVWMEFVPVPSLSTASELTVSDIGTDACTLARPAQGAFSLPACGTIGDAGFDTFTGPNTFFSDLSLTKNFRITERINARFRFDAYNVFNHVNLGFNSNQGNTCIDCGGNAGQITDIEADGSPGSPTGMRQLQFGLRVTF
jgi:outer membrane receptor protein involved in Fe transport